MRLTVSFHHDGTFVPLPLMYQEGEESTIHDIEFEGMTLSRLSKKLQGTCMFPVKGIFFLIPGKELSNKLIEIMNDIDLANCIAIDNNEDELSDVEMEDIAGFEDSGFVGEDDVVIPNRSINDPFLNKLCNGSYINDFTDKSDVGESSQPSGKELEIDSDDEDVDKQFKLVDGVIYLEFNPKLPWNEMKPTLGLRFEHPKQLKECMTNYGVANRYQLWYRRYDYRSLFVLCGRDLVEGRTGGKKGKKDAYIRSPTKKGVEGQSFADKGKAVAVQGGLIEHYSRLWDYKKQLLDTNPGSSVHLHVDELDNGKIHIKSIYVCFKAMIEGWSAGCRKVIGLDGCFLKGTCRGELLTAMSRDENNQMFPIAWAVMVTRIDGVSEKLLPYAEHRQCARHIYTNFKKEAKQGLVDRNPNSWCRAFFKMGKGCATYENCISEYYHNAIRIARECITPSIKKEIESLKESQRNWIVPVGDSSMWCNTPEEPPLPPVLRKMSCRPWKLRIKHVTKRVNPKPTVEKRTPGRRKVDSNFVFPTGGKDGGDAGPSVADSSVADPTGADPSVADTTSSGTSYVSDTSFINKDKTIIKDAIATGRLKTARLKRRCKSERIAKRAKALQFGKDGAESYPDKAWDVDEVLVEE
ncbi:hypothetical protein Tco_0420583 [Tanacetum coccineum]